MRHPIASILHLTDLHVGPDCELGLEKPETAARHFSEQIVAGLKSAGAKPKVDLVVITGDIADRASLEGFRLASRFLSATAAELGVSRENFVFAPGNHDISRQRCRQAAIEQTVRDLSDQETEDLLHRSKLDLYRGFLRGFYGGTEPEPDNFIYRTPDPFTPPGALPLSSDCSFLYSFPDLDLSVAALNSCYREADDPSSHVGMIEDKTLDEVLDHWKKPEMQSRIRILTFHHNPNGTSKANRDSWKEALAKTPPAVLQDRTSGVLDRMFAEIGGIEGVDNLEWLVSLSRPHLILFGHHHALYDQSWSWSPVAEETGRAHLFSAGSLGVSKKHRPRGQRRSVRLLLLSGQSRGRGSGQERVVHLQVESLVHEAKHRTGSSATVRGGFVHRPSEAIRDFWTSGRKSPGHAEARLLESLRGLSQFEFVSGNPNFRIWRRRLDRVLRESYTRQVENLVEVFNGRPRAARKTYLDAIQGAAKLSSWFAWYRLRRLTKALGGEALSPPAPFVNAAIRAAQISRRVEPYEQDDLAVGRVLASADPMWPSHHRFLGFLNLWPNRRRLVGQTLQAAVLCGAPRQMLEHLAMRAAELFSSSAALSQERPVLSEIQARIETFLDTDLSRYWSYLTCQGSSDTGKVYEGIVVESSEISQSILSLSEPELDSWAELTALCDSEWLRSWSGDLAERWIKGRTGAAGSYVESSPWILDLAAYLIRSSMRGVARGALAIRAAKSYPYTDDIRELMSAAARSAVDKDYGPKGFAVTADRLRGNVGPLWWSLANIVSKPEEEGHQHLHHLDILKNLAQRPEECGDPDLELGLRFIVRGDVLLPSGEVLSLEDLGVSDLAWIEEPGPEINFDLSGLI